MRGAARVLMALGAGAIACARPYAPPGGERDVTPPRLVSVTPEPLTVVAAGDRPVTFSFDERLSERGFSEALITVSPLDSALRVERSGSEVRVRLDGGWRANRVYRVVLLPGIRDLFGNERPEQVELVFSTGEPVGNTALAGMVMDRVTGLPAQHGLVEAAQRGADARYTAIADSSGFYSLRYLPLGEYDVHAYDDLNRNRRRDPLEPVDSGHSAVFAQPTDTVAVIFSVLGPDTTAPRVTGARSLDSVHVTIEFDDPVDPAQSLESLGVEVFSLPDSVRHAGGARVMTRAVLEEERRAAADTTGAVPGIPADAPMLPVRELVVRLDRALAPGSYRVHVSGVTNLHGLVGGGTAPFEVSPPPPPPPQPSPPDTTGTAARLRP